MPPILEPASPPSTAVPLECASVASRRKPPLAIRRMVGVAGKIVVTPMLIFANSAEIVIGISVTT